MHDRSRPMPDQSRPVLTMSYHIHFLTRLAWYRISADIGAIGPWVTGAEIEIIPTKCHGCHQELNSRYWNSFSLITIRSFAFSNVTYQMSLITYMNYDGFHLWGRFYDYSWNRWVYLRFSVVSVFLSLWIHMLVFVYCFFGCFFACIVINLVYYLMVTSFSIVVVFYCLFFYKTQPK